MAAPKNTTIYTKPGCPFCSRITELYQLKGWPYKEYVLDRNFTREQFYNEFGHGSTFPQLIVDGTNRGGCNETISYFKSQKLL